jgi:hypothetical protein
MSHERLDVIATTAWFVQRILQEHVGRGELVDDGELAGLSQKSVNQWPTMALLSSFDIRYP